MLLIQERFVLLRHRQSKRMKPTSSTNRDALLLRMAPQHTFSTKFYTYTSSFVTTRFSAASSSYSLVSSRILTKTRSPKRYSSSRDGSASGVGVPLTNHLRSANNIFANRVWFELCAPIMCPSSTTTRSQCVRSRTDGSAPCSQFGHPGDRN